MLVLCWILGGLVAYAEPVVLAWSDLPSATVSAYETGPGASWRAELEGLEAARRREPLTGAWVSLQVSPDVRPGEAALDDNSQAMIGITLGDRRGSRRAWWAATASALEAHAEADALAYADAVRSGWLDAWEAAAFAAHLDAYAEELGGLVHGLRDRVEAGVLPALAVDDLEVELSRLRAEAAAEAQRADLAGITLASLLGRAVVVDAASLPSLEAEIGSGDNPWALALAGLDAHPALRALDAETAALRAEARVARSSTPISLSAGALWRVQAGGSPMPGPVIALQVPLANLMAPEARAAAGRAEAMEASRTWALTRLRAEVDAEARTLDATRARHALVVATVEDPLRSRLARLEAALAAGAVTVDALILAGRDLHDAFHSRAQVAAELIACRARGEALLSTLNAQEGR